MDYKELIQNEDLGTLVSFRDDMVEKRIERIGEIPWPDESLEVNCCYDALDAIEILQEIPEEQHLEACQYLNNYITKNIHLL